MSLAKEQACGEELSNRLIKRFERKASFARSISDNDYESARIGAAAKRCALRGERYAKHAVRSSVNALKRMTSSKRSSMKWAMGGLNSVRSLIYLDWIEEELNETISEEAARTISGWAPREQQQYQGAKVSQSPWLVSKSRPARIVKTKKGRYTAAKVAPKRLSRRTEHSVAEHPSLPNIPQPVRRKASALERLQAKGELAQAQRTPVAKAIRSLGPSLNRSRMAERLVSNQSDSKQTAKTPIERLFAPEIQKTKSDKQVAAADVAAARIQKGATKKNGRSRGLRPTWNRSPMMRELLKVHEGGLSSENSHGDVEEQSSSLHSDSGVRTISGWAKSAAPTESYGQKSKSQKRPSSQVATRSAITLAERQQRSVMPAPTVEQVTDILTSSRSKAAFESFSPAALKQASERRLIESLRRSATSALPPVSVQSQRAKRLRARGSNLLNPAEALSQQLPQEMQGNIRLAWPGSSQQSSSLGLREQEHQISEESKSTGLETVQRRGEASDLETFAERLQSSIQPYHSNVTGFQPQAAESKRGKTKDLWLMTPNMVVTEPQDSLGEGEDQEAEQSAPRISAWTGAPVVDSPWLSSKNKAAPTQIAANRIAQRDSSRKNRSVLPKIKSVQPELDRLIGQLPKQVKAKWQRIVDQVGTLTVAQQEALQEHVHIAAAQKSNKKAAQKIESRFATSNEASKSKGMAPIQRASIRDVVSRSGNPTRGVMTSILASSGPTSQTQISQALDAVQQKKNLQKSSSASTESFWVDIFRSQQQRTGNRTSSLAYGRPESVIVVPEVSPQVGGEQNIQSNRNRTVFDVAAEERSSPWLSSRSANTDSRSSDTRTKQVSGRTVERGSFASSSREHTTLASSGEPTSFGAFEHALERLESKSEIGFSQQRAMKKHQARLPAWAKGWNIPEAQYLDAIHQSIEGFEGEAGTVGGSGGSSGSNVVNGWGASRAASMMSGAKQLAYIHKSGKVIPVSQAKQAGLPAPKLGARAQLPLGWTLEAVDAQVLNRAMPGWAQRASEKPLIRGNSDTLKALVNARSQDEVIRVIFDRANEPMPELRSLPTSATRVIEQIRKEAHIEQSVAVQTQNDRDSMSRLSASGQSRRRESANVVSGFSGLRAISTATQSIHESEDKVSKLAKKLQDLVLLAEEKSRKEARQGIRMADNDEAAHNEGAAISHDDAPDSFTSHDIDAFFQAVIDAYEREREFRKDRDGFEGNQNKNRTTWW